MKTLTAKNKHEAVKTIVWLAGHDESVWQRVRDAKPKTFADWKNHFEATAGWVIGDYLITIDPKADRVNV